MKPNYSTWGPCFAFLLLAYVGMPQAVVYGQVQMAVTSSGEIIEGGPSASQARDALEERIHAQSEGKMKLRKFTATKTNFTEIEVDNQIPAAVSFDSEVEALNVGHWIFNQHGHPLTFKLVPTVQPDAIDRSIREQSVEIHHAGEIFTVRGSIWFRLSTNDWKVAGFVANSNPQPLADNHREGCINHLRQISVGFALWLAENNDVYSFNLSTNKGGTLEFCKRDKEGFENNPAVHFQTLSNDLSIASILVCPGDSSRKSAANFRNLASENVSYRLRTGRSVNVTNLTEVLLVCPVHHHVLYADGSMRDDNK